MADEDIDSLLEQGIRAAAAEKHDHPVKSESNGGTNGHDATDPAADSSSRRSRSVSKSRSRSASRSRRKSSRRDRRSRSRSSGRPRASKSSRRSSRSRSRSSGGRRRRSDRRTSRSRSRSRSGSRGRDRDRRRRRRRSRSADKPKPVEPRARSTSAERAERAKQRELMELTRDHRTVFIGQLTQKVRERDLDKFFGQLGKLEHVLLIRDKFTNRSKGFAYVEMSNLEDVPKILMMNGQVPDFQSFPIMVKASEAEKNFAARKDSVMNTTAKALAGATLGSSFGGAAGGGGGHGPDRGASSAAARIYCGNVHTNITEDDLRAVFQAFGEVLSVTINRDELGRSRGYGFIQFSTPQEANFALSKGNGLELAGNYLKLGCVNDNSGGGGGGGGDHGANGGGGGGWKLDDDDGIGMTMNAQSRTALMAKLAGNKNLFPTPAGNALFPGAAPLSGLPTTISMAPVGAAPPSVTTAQQYDRAVALASVEIEGAPSFCFVIKNMFDIQEEKQRGDPDWHLEIKQDVEEECETYGAVLHSFVERDKAGGLVYVLFENESCAVAAAQRLHGRWFSQRQISVRYLSPQEYVGMFPEARMAVQTARANSQA